MNKLKLFPTIGLVSLALALPATGFAQGQPGAQPSAEQQAKIQSLAQEYQQIAGQLEQIRKATYQANPELAEQRDDFQEMVEERMADSGFDAEANVEEMKSIAEKLEGGDVAESKKQKLVQDFQQKRQQLANARREVLDQPEVRQAGEKLREDTLVAMKAQDQNTQSLLDRLEDIGKNLQSMSGQG